MSNILTIYDVILLSSYLISAVLSLFLGYLFFNKYSRSNFYVHFLLLTLSVFFIGFGHFLLFILPKNMAWSICLHITSIFLYLFPALFVHFIVKMADFKEYDRNWFIYVSMFYFPAVFFILLPFLSSIVPPYKTTSQIAESIEYMVPPHAMLAFLLYIIAHFFYSSFFLLKFRRGNITKELRKKTDIIFMGASIAFVLGFLPEIIMHRLGIVMFHGGVFVILLSLITIAFALYKFRLHVHIPDAFFKAIMEIMSDLLLVLDSSGRIIYSSKSTNKMLGYSTDELYQMEFKLLFKEKNSPLFYKNGEPVFPYDRIVEFTRKNTIKDYDIDMESKNGDVIPMNVTISPFIEDEFDRLYLLMIGKDMRELKNLIDEINSYKDELEEKVKDRTKELRESNETLKETQASLIQSEKISAMGMLAGGVAHEVNTPLSGVLGYVELLIQKLESRKTPEVDMDFVLEKLRVVRECGIRCKAISEKFLEFSRKASIEFEKSNIHFSIDDALMVTRNKIKYEVEVEKNFARDLPYIYGNGNELQQVFVNLIINASDAMDSKKGKITITTKLSGDNVVVEFKDNGAGIKEEDLEKIFKSFFTTKPPGKGTGLGLSVTVGIIKKHKGTIEVKSKEGEGTSFIISFPNADLAKQLFEKEESSLS